MTEINYPEIMAEALRGMVAEVLKSVEASGLPDKNYFVMTFRTDHPGAELPGRLRAEYPHEMQIVMQHWFRDLNVGDAGFWVTLNFGNTPEPIYVPFTSLTAFADPGAGVQFKFLPLDMGEEVKADSDGGPGDEPDESADGPRRNEPAQVVSLDKFRKS